MENIVVQKSTDFALRIVQLYKSLCDTKREYVLSKQLLKSGTSIGANVREAVQAQSRKDFLSKMNIALKEATETEYWIELLVKSNYLEGPEGTSITDECAELKRILHAIVKTTKSEKPGGV